MHFFINICRSCLRCDNALLRERPIKNEWKPENVSNYFQQIQTIYPDLQLCKTLPFQLCCECQGLTYESTKIIQFLNYQTENEHCHKLLLKDNTCNGCLKECKSLTNQLTEIDALDVCKKTNMDIIRNMLPQYKVDSHILLKYCESCSKYIKSYYVLKSLLIRNNPLYEKYCFIVLNTTDFHHSKFSKLFISLQRTPNHISRNDFLRSGITIKEEMDTNNYTIDIKIENDEDQCFNFTDIQQTYQLDKEMIKQEGELNDEDNFNDNIIYKSKSFQNLSTYSPILDINKQTCTTPQHDQIWLEKEPFNNDYILSHPQYHLKQDKKTKVINKPYKCNYCPKSYTQSKNLKRHEKIHPQHITYKCNYCLKSFVSESNLTEHKKFHMENKPHKCNYCSDSFRKINHLKDHERLHTGEKPYNCNYCSKTFCRKSDSIKHERIHTGEKPYKCGYCTKTFCRKSDVIVHERIHTGDKPYKCSYCQKTFIQSIHFIKHERTHTKEKPYECSYCSLSFSEKGTLTKHIRFHTGEKPYKCAYCSESFMRNDYLKNHERIHASS